MDSFFMLLLLIPFDTFYDVFVPCAYLQHILMTIQYVHHRGLVLLFLNGLFVHQSWRSLKLHQPEQSFNLTRWYAQRVYIQNTLSAPIMLAHSLSKPKTQVYIYLLKIKLFLNSHYHALCTVVSFILFFFYLTDTGYAPNFFSKHRLSLWFIVMFKNICIFCFFFFWTEIIHLFDVQFCQATKMI